MKKKFPLPIGFLHSILLGSQTHQRSLSVEHNLKEFKIKPGHSILTKPNDGKSPTKQDNTRNPLLIKPQVNENLSKLSLKQGLTAGLSVVNCSTLTPLQLLSSSMLLSFLSLQRLLAFVWGWMRLNGGAHQGQLNIALAAIGCGKNPKNNSSFSMSLSEPFILWCALACLVSDGFSVESLT